MKLFARIRSDKAVALLEKRVKDYPINRRGGGLWSDIGLEFQHHYNEGLYINFRVIDKEKFMFLMMKYSFDIEFFSNL